MNMGEDRFVEAAHSPPDGMFEQSVRSMSVLVPPAADAISATALDLVNVMSVKRMSSAVTPMIPPALVLFQTGATAETWPGST